MSSTLYRKYRPKNFSEIIGQKHILETLKNSILKERIGQAYLFTGPRGTGKTSIARILAKTINCEDPKKAIACEKCSACKNIGENKSLDIIEIDAASNTGVDNIREIKETVALPPTSLKYKVYIIDEVHMLSSGAFNALLKTLEEPPKHVVFILATTEIHKVPETIISRCQRFDFTRLPIQNIIEKLSLIAKNEKIKIDKPALESIAIAAEGGMRDAESLLAQIISLEDKNITLKEVETILGTSDRESVQKIAASLIEKNSEKAIGKINDLLENGYDLAIFNKSLINYFRQLMLLKVNPELKKHFSYEMPEEQLAKLLSQKDEIELERILKTIDFLIEAQTKISSFILPQLPLEMAIIKATDNFPKKFEKNNHSQESPKEPEPISPSNSKNEPENSQTTKEKEPEIIKEKTEKPEPEDPEIEKTEAIPDGKDVDFDLVRQNWQKLLNDIKPFNHSLSALLSSCKPIETKGQEIILATPFSFYKEKLEDPANRLTVEDVFGSILGLKIRVKMTVDKDIFPKKEASEKIDEGQGSQENKENLSLLDSALEIMGGKIVSE